MTEEMLASMKEYIEEELELQNQVHGKVTFRYDVKDTNVGTPLQAHSSQQKIITRKPCFYCEKAGHSSNDCYNVRTTEERLNVMLTCDLCHNCGSGNHRTPTCQGGSCLVCHRYGYHTSTCRRQSITNKQFASTERKKKESIVVDVNDVGLQQRQSLDSLVLLHNICVATHEEQGHQCRRKEKDSLFQPSDDHVPQEDDVLEGNEPLIQEFRAEKHEEDKETQDGSEEILNESEIETDIADKTDKRAI
ncbi:hypothetical protein KIN20_015077 [Parelaphostrongylus tenuis]|uniref:CCHC-type domain-containing protein n=1 Tax=Parelaphostrongylus tenuis TaxID=148309 RepID=A0AAD5MI14_PARTN|nr:hypothetical protein KIN20_015077 [Parelaphostrongylus tenuis]